MNPEGNVIQLTMLNNDVTNSADFATILSIFSVAHGAYGQAAGVFSANPKDVNVIIHEFGHTFGGGHSFDNKNNDPKKGYAFGYDYIYNISYNKFGTPLSYSNQPLYYWSNPRINHPKFGVPLGHENANDMARKITEDRFSLNRGDESRACYTCNAYSGQRLHITCRCATGEIDHNCQEAVIYKMNKTFLLPISLLVCAQRPAGQQILL